MSTDPKTYFTDTADPGQTDFSFNFEYLEDAHVTVTIDGVATTDFTIVTSPAKKIVLDTPATGGEIVRVQRISAPDENLVDFVNGSVLTESELDRAYLHNRYLAEESAEQNDISLRVKTGATGSFDALNKKIVNVSDPTADQDAATKNYVDDTVAGVALGTLPDGSITAAKLDTDAVTTTKIEDGAVTAAKISTTDTKFNVQSDGKVGIGTASPDVKLSVNGQIESLTGIGGEGGQLILRSQSGGSYRWNIDHGGGANELFRIFNEDDADLANGVVRLSIDPVTGYVNIGSGVASHALDVSGDVNVSLGNTFKINGANFLLDEDTMSSNSDTQGATQQSIKAYVDSQVVSKWNSGWFNDTTGLVNGSTYSFSHTLGTAVATVQIWMATSSGGANIKQVVLESVTGGGTSTTIAPYGGLITDITSSNITVQLGSSGWYYYDASGNGTTGNWGTTYTHIQVVAIG